jgi:hypothetical protein
MNDATTMTTGEIQLLVDVAEGVAEGLGGAAVLPGDESWRGLMARGLVAASCSVDAASGMVDVEP